MSRLAGRRSFAVAALLGSGALMALAAPSAHASWVFWNTDGELDTIRYVAGPGERNDLIYTETVAGSYFIDQGATIHAGEGCASVSRHIAKCDDGRASIELGARNDRLSVGDVGCHILSRSPIAALVSLGIGDDVFDGRLGIGLQLGLPPSVGPNCRMMILGDEGSDLIQGGLGREDMIGGPGRDTCRGDGGSNDTATECEVVQGVP